MTRSTALFVALSIGGGCGGGSSPGDGAVVHDASRDAVADAPRAHDGEGDSAQEVTPSGPATSFEVAATIYLDGGLGTTESLLVHIDEPNDRLVISWRGRATNVPFDQTGGDLVANGSIFLADPCRDDVLTVELFVLRRMGDGVKGELSGQWDTVDGTGQPVGTPFTGTFTGVRDVTSPRLDYCWFQGHVVKTPTDVFRFMLSEPLPPGVVVRLVGDDGSVIGFTPEAGEEPSAGFTVAAALAFGRSYQLQINPFVDLAGNPGDGRALPNITTPSLGFAVEDGFETDWPRVATAGTRIITTTTWPPPLTGERSLRLPAGGSFTARLHVLPGERTVRLSTRPILPADFDQSTYYDGPVGYLRMAAPGGKVVEKALPAISPPYEWDLDAALSVRRDVVFNLPAGVTDEVIVTIFSDGGFADVDPYPDLVIDDLRIE